MGVLRASVRTPCFFHILVLGMVASGHAFVATGRVATGGRTGCRLSAATRSVCASALSAGMSAATCPAENPGNERKQVLHTRLPASAASINLRHHQPSVLAGPAAHEQQDSVGYEARDQDPEAMHLWSKMPESLRARYRYLGVLGRGAFGIVILARARQEHVESRGGGENAVAVKVVRTARGAEPLALQEGLVQSSINSPLVPRCFDYGISNEIVYNVQEYIEGGETLDKVLQAEGPLSPDDVREIGIQIAAALDDVHASGFVHRDVKPSNIIRVGRGSDAVYRLIDYGTATGVGGCLFGGAVHEKVSACFSDPHPSATSGRLRALYRSLCTSDRDTLSADHLAECLRASGLQADRAKRICREMLHAHSASHAEGGNEAQDLSTVLVEEDQFAALFPQLLRAQDMGCPAGTFSYMAPEQFLRSTNQGATGPGVDAPPEGSSEPTYSPRSDLYSLGVTLYQLLSGKLPLEAPATKGRATRQSIHQQFETWLQRHNWNDNSCPPPVAPGLPVLDQVISQALSKSRELRQRTAHELSQQLQHGYRPTAPSDTRASVELPSGMTAP
eukprot:Tamp_09442.p1 GENE.Tamp_09442~~Tamp_09442.p1  ORF type:complete len:562 (-),score=53.51 Tamp_09442:390-2075(-)